MANSMKNEQEIYEKIKNQNITIHPLIWELMDHHISNDLYIINIIIGSTILDGQPFTEENAKSILEHSKSIKSFLSKLGKETRKNTP
ncbi:MAG: hypothetical protein NTX01_09205 [Candidatus Omnitrophica bacterium]|nr:hypothetical protein [Candidatus Omnitrophota bacterium]